MDPLLETRNSHFESLNHEDHEEHEENTKGMKKNKFLTMT